MHKMSNIIDFEFEIAENVITRDPILWYGTVFFKTASEWNNINSWIEKHITFLPVQSVSAYNLLVEEHQKLILCKCYFLSYIANSEM